ncbi:MAG: DUF2281 domain-containing protein, partial [bacterium]
MTEAEKIAEKMKHLPEEVQVEVYDFVEFLEQKHGKYHIQSVFGECHWSRAQ